MTDDTQAPPFDRGGWIPGGSVFVTLDDAECVLLPADVLAGAPRCRRGDQVHLDAAHGGHPRPRGLRAAYRAARLWLAFQTRPRCTGDANCRAHPGIDGPHMGWTWDSWRDYVPPQRRQR